MVTEPTPTQPTPTQTATAQPDPATTIRSLTTLVKALVRRYGQAQATQPLSFTDAFTMRELEEATATTIRISPQAPTDMQPEPWLLVTLEGI